MKDWEILLLFTAFIFFIIVGFLLSNTGSQRQEGLVHSMSADKRALPGGLERGENMYLQITHMSRDFICHLISSLQHLEMSHNIVLTQERSLRGSQAEGFAPNPLAGEQWSQWAQTSDPKALALSSPVGTPAHWLESDPKLLPLEAPPLASENTPLP